MVNQNTDVEIPFKNGELKGLLFIPEKAKGIVLFVHGSGSSRLSKRNQHVANILNESNLATLLFDLLLPEEEAIDELTMEHRFNIPLLATRLLIATDWIEQQSQLAIGYFGASTGAAAALMAASERQRLIKAIVSRGGRPDLGGKSLGLVKAPTLLIVGGNDYPVIDMNKHAMDNMHCVTKLEIVPKATHLFEEPGTLDIAANLAKNWFLKFLTAGDS